MGVVFLMSYGKANALFFSLDICGGSEVTYKQLFGLRSGVTGMDEGMMEGEMEKTAARFKALSEETRLRILKLLEEGELCVCDIAAALDMTQPNISFHLAILKEAGFIKDWREGRWIHYELDLSSMFNKILLPTALGGVNGKVIEADVKRLGEFRQAKAPGNSCVTLN